MEFSHVIRSFIVLLIVVSLHLPRTISLNSEPRDNITIPTIDVSQAQRLLDSGYTFLDVRTVEEYKKGHVDTVRVFNVPYWFFTQQGHENNPNFLKHVSCLCNQTDHLVVGCKTGVRSLYATEDLISSGFKSVTNMDGGYIAWIKKKLPVKEEVQYDEL